MVYLSNEYKMSSPPKESAFEKKKSLNLSKKSQKDEEKKHQKKEKKEQKKEPKQKKKKKVQKKEQTQGGSEKAQWESEGSKDCWELKKGEREEEPLLLSPTSLLICLRKLPLLLPIFFFYPWQMRTGVWKVEKNNLIFSRFVFSSFFFFFFGVSRRNKKGKGLEVSLPTSEGKKKKNRREMEIN